MDLDLTSDQQLLRDTTRKFLHATVPLTAVRALAENPAGFDSGWWRRGYMHGRRACGITIPWLVGRRVGGRRRRGRLVVGRWRGVIHPRLWFGHVSSDVRIIVSASGVRGSIGVVSNGHTA